MVCLSTESAVITVVMVTVIVTLTSMCSIVRVRACSDLVIRVTIGAANPATVCVPARMGMGSGIGSVGIVTKRAITMGL